jgi:hypothetical protein
MMIERDAAHRSISLNDQRATRRHFPQQPWHRDVEGIRDRGSYFQGARSTPRPIKLVRHAGHGPWDNTAFSAQALSKMNWSNDALYDPLPVTMGYAQILARVVKRMTGLGSEPYQFHFFM